jgi:hypothetical protein
MINLPIFEEVYSVNHLMQKQYKLAVTNLVIYHIKPIVNLLYCVDVQILAWRN